MLFLMLFSSGYPVAVLSQMGTATWCGYCPNAYAGIETMKGEFNNTEFVALRYYSSSNGGQLANSYTDSVIRALKIRGYPTVIFNGEDYVVGAGSPDGAANMYRPNIKKHLYNLSPAKLSISSSNTSFAVADYSVDVKVELLEDIEGSFILTIVMYEDNVNAAGKTHQNVVRDGKAFQLDIDKAGEEKTFSHSFSTSGYNASNLHVIAFLQRTSDNSVIQAISDLEPPEHYARVCSNNRVKFCNKDSEEGIDIVVANVGKSAEDISMETAFNYKPNSWNASLSSESFHLSKGEFQEITLQVKNNSFSYADIKVKALFSGSENSMDVSFITKGSKILLVDDDGSETFEHYFTDVLDELDVSYGVLERSRLIAFTGNELNDFGAVFWSCGWAFPTLTVNDRTAIKNYLDNGKNLFLTGQDIGWELCDGNSSNATPDAKSFYSNYLHATYIKDDADKYNLSGVSGDTISNGLNLHIAGGDGADNQDYPSIIKPYDDKAKAIFNYSASECGAIRAEAVYKVVYLAFGFEAIDNAADRKTLIERIINWFNPQEQTSGILDNVTINQTVILHSGVIRLNDLADFNINDVVVMDINGRKIGVKNAVAILPGNGIYFIKDKKNVVKVLYVK